MRLCIHVLIALRSSLPHYRAEVLPLSGLQLRSSYQIVMECSKFPANALCVSPMLIFTSALRHHTSKVEGAPRTLHVTFKNKASHRRTSEALFELSS
jgi:hypothetical protein